MLEADLFVPRVDGQKKCELPQDLFLHLQLRVEHEYEVYVEELALSEQAVPVDLVFIYE